MKCPKCGTEFDSKFCPNCGTPAQEESLQPQAANQNMPTWNKRNKKKLKPGKIVGIVFGSIILFIVLIGVLVTAFPSGNAESSSAIAAGVGATSKQLSPNSSMSGVMKVDCKTLYKDYSDNPISADSKYKDKKLQLTGTVANIDRDIGQNPYITFNLDEYGAQSIKMSFDNDKIVADLKKGQKVTVVGTCGGTFTSTLVVLNNCELVK